MTVGIPGVGLGGIFYLVSALLMPVHHFVRRLSGQTTPRWGLVMRQLTTACGILAALWLTGLALGVVIAALPDSFSPSHSIHASERVHNVLRGGALVLSLGTLVVVLTLVHVARLVVHYDINSRRRRASRVTDVGAPVTLSGAGRPRDLRVDSGTFGRER
jgi:hypothetical protein